MVDAHQPGCCERFDRVARSSFATGAAARVGAFGCPPVGERADMVYVR
jgi:hypothetical protein